MKRIAVVSILLLAGIAVWVVAQAPAPMRSPADYVPAGPLLYLEAGNFAALVRDWNGSPEKRLWLDSANYEVFSRSRLFLRLKEAQQEFAGAAGIPPDMALVESVAGGQSALALYEIGQLHFLYLTRLPSARAFESLLWQTRTNYEPRESAGMPYYVRIDPASRRVAAFAVADDLLLLATREDLIAGSLALLAGQGGDTIRTERWYDESVRAAGPAGDLRLVMNLAVLTRSPYFRSYWIQRNAADLPQYGAGIADVHRTPEGIREERVLLRFDAPDAKVPAEALGGLLRLAPDSAGMYRAWAGPAPGQVMQVLRDSILAPRPAAAPFSRYAPAAPPAGALAGSEADLEVRIDERPLEVDADFAGGPLESMLRGAGIEGMLEVGSSARMPGGVFVGLDSGVAVLAAQDWNPEAVRAALAASLERMLTISGLGAGWVERNGAFELDGLVRLAVATQDRLLIVASTADLVTAMLARLATPAVATDATYAAGFRHDLERENFARLSSLLDHPISRMPEGAEEGVQVRPPHFLSENVASLSRTLERVQSSSITVRDTGAAVFQTVTYRTAR